MKIFGSLIIVLLSSACSSIWYSPNVSTHNPIEAATYVAIAIALSEKPSQECKDKAGEKQQQCLAQVAKLKQSLENARRDKVPSTAEKDL